MNYRSDLSPTHRKASGREDGAASHPALPPRGHPRAGRDSPPEGDARDSRATEKYFEIAQIPRLSRREAAAAIGKSTPQDREAIGFALFDKARNELLQALGARQAGGTDPIMAIRTVMWLSPGAGRRLRRELMQVLGRLQREQRPERSRLGGEGKSRRRNVKRYALTISMVPMAGGDGPAGCAAEIECHKTPRIDDDAAHCKFTENSHRVPSARARSLPVLC